MELVLRIQPDLDLPLHRQVYEQIRVAILTGRLRSRQRLPASRQLAKSLGISRTTVTQSYDQLISEGYLQARQGAGTFVCAQVPDELLQADQSVASPLKKQQPRFLNSTGKSAANDFRLSDYGRHIQTLAPRNGALAGGELDGELSFRYGVPAMDGFPVEPWKRLASRCSTASTSWMNYSDDPMGYRPLREQIAHYLTQSRAVRCTPAQILITNGTQQALSLIVRLMIDPGDAIAVEDPGYLSAKRIFTSGGATILPVPVDSEGLRVDGTEGLSNLPYPLGSNLSPTQPPNWSPQPVPKLVYVTPSHQFPTGVLMSLSRRLALLQWAQQVNALIIEDDYDSEFRYSGRPVPALQGLDSEDRVLYVGTFSKVMFPGLRLGYIVLPQALIPLFKRAKWLNDRQGSLIDQQTLTEFMREGHLAKHVRRMRSLYEVRRRSLIEGLQSLSGGAVDSATERSTACTTARGAVEILGDESGLHVMARLPMLHSNHHLIAQAKAQGVRLFSAQPHYWQNDENDSPEGQLGHGEFIFGFGGIAEQGIQMAIARIKPFF